jgi:hypothetical protein
MQTIRTYVKKPLTLAVIGFVLIVCIIGIGSLVSYQLDNTDCQQYNYNEKLNGGVKEFNGKKFTINICGSGTNNSHFFGDSMDKVLLTIINDQGELLAKMHYKVFWDGQPRHEPLTIGKDSITYQDDEKQADHTITMPPTFIDWIRARIPLFN